MHSSVILPALIQSRMACRMQRECAHRWVAGSAPRPPPTLGIRWKPSFPVAKSPHDGSSCRSIHRARFWPRGRVASNRRRVIILKRCHGSSGSASASHPKRGHPVATTGSNQGAARESNHGFAAMTGRRLTLPLQSARASGQPTAGPTTMPDNPPAPTSALSAIHQMPPATPSTLPAIYRTGFRIRAVAHNPGRDRLRDRCAILDNPRRVLTPR
jgi:hypothetical protein